MQARIDPLTVVSLTLAILVFIVDLLWLYGGLSIGNDRGEMVAFAFTAVWAVFTFSALVTRPTWLLAISSAFALCIPIALQLGDIGAAWTRKVNVRFPPIADISTL